MICLDDGALARLAIRATAVPPSRRRRWLADTLAPPSPAALRQRAYRARQRRGEACVRVTVTRELLDALVAGEWLHDAEVISDQEIGDAVQRMLAEWAALFR